jgi:hypothetical protein
MENEFIIDISAPKKSFDTSLDLPGNNRLIFSAPFGCGKTFFLKRFFNESPKFLALHLYPVNYSVSKNEDIFELIKYDILYELLTKEVSLDKLEVSFSEAIPFLDSEEQTKAIGQFLSFVPKIGKTVVDVFSGIKKLGQTIDDKRKKLGKNDGNEIKEFADSIHQSKGSIYEIDFYSNLIIDLVKRLKLEKEKDVVLIIDDLDRIDPDHIFRLLNVFASHLDLGRSEENKFGFDKIIFSCDIENVRTIFHNKFGQDVDFSGYIDKFYSREVFEFNNKTIVAQSISKILTSIKIDKKHEELNNISNSQKIGFSYIKYFLVSFVSSNAINLRILLKLANKEYEIRNYYFFVTRRETRNWKISISMIFDFLIDLFGDAKALKRAIDKTIFSTKLSDDLGIREEHIAHLCGELMLLADIGNSKLTALDKSKPPYSLNLNGKLYNYQIEMYDFRYERLTAYLVNESGQRFYSPDDFDIKLVIQRAYDSYSKLERHY